MLKLSRILVLISAPNSENRIHELCGNKLEISFMLSKKNAIDNLKFILFYDWS